MYVALGFGTAFALNEMVALKSFLDTNEFQAALGRAHWDTEGMDVAVIQPFYHWTTG